MRLTDDAFRNDKNSLRINTHNKLEHERTKLDVMYMWIKKGKTCFSEVKMKGGGCADVLIPEDFRIVEVLHTETMKEALSKTKKYPMEFEIDFVTTKEEIK